MIKIANNISNLLKKQAAYAPRTNMPFNVHAGPGQHYYSYDNYPAQSMLPEVFEETIGPLVEGPRSERMAPPQGLTPQDFAAALNTSAPLASEAGINTHIPPRGRFSLSSVYDRMTDMNMKNLLRGRR